MADFRFLTPTDVDRFIQIPDTLQVDARSIVLTVEEDTLQKYDHYFKITDYVIYCELTKDKFFNDASGSMPGQMDWKYKIVKRRDASNNQFLGPHVEDGHGPSNEIANDIIKVEDAKTELGINANSTRWVHYKQCNRFFKYSFKVGDAVDVPILSAAGSATGDTRKGQLFAVYLDTDTGVAMPYYDTTYETVKDTQTAETRTYYYMDSYTDAASATVDVSDLLTTINGGAALSIELSNTDNSQSSFDISVICPPDPEFLEDSGTVIGGNLVVTKTAGALDIRQVGQMDVSGVLTSYTSTNFQEYTAGNRSLMLYWVVNPIDSDPFTGEEMYVAWCSDDIRPVRDMVDASGARYPDQYGRTFREVDRFTFARTVTTKTGYNVHVSLRPTEPISTAAPRMYLPVSKFIVRHDNPNEPDVHNDGADEFDVPFAYEFANATDFGGEHKKSIIGGRIMQLVSQYLFDDATNKEMQYFPFLLNESKALTDRILLALASKIKESSTSVGASRTEILKQIMIKYGRRYFEEYATLAAQTDETNVAAYGKVWDVLSKIDEIFLFFTVTVRTTVSNRTKDDVEVIRLVDVPVVIRVYDS